MYVQFFLFPKWSGIALGGGGGDKNMLNSKFMFKTMFRTFIILISKLFACMIFLKSKTNKLG
jgi:hypothetical protein